MERLNAHKHHKPSNIPKKLNNVNISYPCKATNNEKKVLITEIFEPNKCHIKKEVFNKIADNFKYYLEKNEKIIEKNIEIKRPLSSAITKLRPKRITNMPSITNTKPFKNEVIIEKLKKIIPFNDSQNLKTLTLTSKNYSEKKIISPRSKVNINSIVTKLEINKLNEYNLVPFMRIGEIITPNCDISMPKQKRREVNLVNSKFLENLHLSKKFECREKDPKSIYIGNSHFLINSGITNNQIKPNNQNNAISYIQNPNQKFITFYHSELIDYEKDNHLIKLLKFKKQFFQKQMKTKNRTIK